VRNWAIALLLGVASLLSASVAFADERRIAVLEPDGELLRALVLALSPWGVEPVRIDEPPPAASPSGAISVATRLSRELGVEGVVWVSISEQGALLWVFDAHTDEVTTRLLSRPPPFDGATAAAVALSVKTVLRPSLTARPPSPPSPPSPPPEVEREQATVRVERTQAGAGSFALELRGGAELVRPGALEPRGEALALLWILAADRLGMSIVASTGPGVRIEDARYRGKYRDVALGGAARFRVLRGQSFSTTLALGGAAHWTTLRGAVVSGSAERTVRRLNASLDAEACASFSVGGGLYLGAALGAAYFPRYRRYLVEGRPVFSPWPVASNLKGYVGVELF
jgi:hypothetical protein